MNSMWRYRLLCMSACVIPVAGAMLSRYLPIGRGPASAAAATPVDIPAPFHMPSLDGAGSISTAAQAIESLRSKPFGKTPVWLPMQLDPVVSQQHVSSEPDSSQSDARRKNALAELKTFEVSSILTGRQPLAVMAGKPRKVGDEVRGWKITAIDPAAGVVDVRHDEFGTERLHLKKKVLEESAAGSNGVRQTPSR